MRFGHTRNTRLRRWSMWIVVFASLTGLLFAACEEGREPYQVIDPAGNPPDFLPADGVVPGITHDLGLLYYYDRTKYSLWDPLPGTDARFIKRSLVLAPAGATAEQRLHPDLVDETLASVYSNPRLFGFVGAPPEEVGFREGEIVENAHEFLPLENSSGPSTWVYNHDQLLWTRVDSLVGTDMAPESQIPPSGPVYRMRNTSTVRQDRRNTYLPAEFSADVLVSSTPGAGIFYHSFTIVSERVEIIPEGEFRAPRAQSNPRFLWLSIGSLGSSSPNASVPTTVDQCLDGLWGELKLFPIQLTRGDLQVGDRMTTWTYVEVDSAGFAPRIRAEEPRCLGTGFIPEDTGVDIYSSVLPTPHFSLLARYEAVVENAYDQWVQRGGQAGANAIVGRYGAADGVIDIVKLVVTMYLGAPSDTPVQRVEMYLLRNVGVVVQVTGIFRNTRATTRLRRATINGQVFDEAYFQYLD